MRLIIDVDKRHKRLFEEAAKAVQAKIRVDKHYLTEEEEDSALGQLVVEGAKQGRASKDQQDELERWLFAKP